MELYVSVSKIEEYRKLLETDYVTEQGLIASITAPTPIGWQGLYGEALHACIEDPDKWRDVSKDYVWTSRDGQKVMWPADIVEPCAAAWPRPCVFERRASRDYDARSHRVTVGGRTDGVYGLMIVEGKTKFSYFNPLDYAESAQWKFYLAACPWAPGVQYRVHDIGGMYNDEGKLRIGRDGAYLSEIHEFTLWRQPDTEAYVQNLVTRFVDWAESKALLGHLKPWGAK